MIFEGVLWLRSLCEILTTSIVERLKARARNNERSLEAEVRLILEQSARVDMAQARQIVMERRKKLQGREFIESMELIHEDRER